ncbi:hypothetical protein GCM10011487_02350 [Steroidobacter agaridevorans]|uniref:DUF4175 family protein n=1 Tax=Steroidobacter agaridevorans TaxID=2695856 RepID=A0A829Y5F0_9GAMM|nr:hypothetical protein [Steroidobacter agaridevorans]GFE78235.1 hypothetical protein GCM10011487_02350 [Steroidobacter agaridevorans]
MTSRERLESYLAELRSRLRAHIYLRAGAVGAAGTLLLTCIAVWLFNQEGFAASIAISARIALVVLLLLVGLMLLWLPLRRLKRDDGSKVFEQHLPAEHGRIQTYLDSKRREAEGHASPLIELLAADAAEIAEKTPPSVIVSQRRFMLAASIAVVAVVALALLLSVGPSYWGFGSRHLLLGAELPRAAITLKRVTVEPGDATVRRNSDVAIQATIEGFRPDQTQVFVRFADQQQWEAAPMRSAEEGLFDFKLYAVRGPLSYYVEADGVRSAEHNIGVVDLPKIERVRLTYQYPEWTGLDATTDEESRDIRAVAGTDVKVEVFADAPLDAPALIVDGLSQELEQDGQASIGTIAVKDPGKYQIGARVADEFVALSDEYTIEIVADEKPTIEIRKPGRDWRATSIEEVPVHIQAEDDFKLRDVSLLYSVNGGEWKKMPVGGGAKRSENESLLSMEDLGAKAAEAQRLVPGDLVSYYAVAKDRKQTVQTDLFMVQVQPFERTFKQGQGGGGGGGGMADEQGAISERQREILLATWNLQRSDERNNRSREQLEDSARMLADFQTTLSTQARTLAQRTRARMDVDSDDRVKTFVESLERAAGLMEPAAGHLSAFRLQEAVTPEQQALQQLLRAESAFREVQVSMQQDGGGEGSQAARNFSEMFELEMDVEKSQYESESQLSQQNSQQELNEAIRKLKELAERQEKLAQQQRNAQALQEQRWQQEQLRREAEDLRRRLNELNRQQQSSQQQQQANNSSRQSQGGGSSGSSGSNAGDKGQRSSGSNSQERSEVEQALQSVEQALEQMRAANQSQGENGANAQSAQEASKHLRQALKQIDKPDGSRLDETLERFADRSDQMLENQRRIESELYKAMSQGTESTFRSSGRGGLSQREVKDLVEAKQRLASELSELQGDMRGAVHEHRTKTPKSTQRLSEIVRDIEGSDVMYRLNRSAAEVYYGRAREAAPREGLITDALESLEHDLREAATQASTERSQKRDSVTTDDLLAEVAELRRAVRSAQRSGEEQGGQAGQQGEANQGQGDQAGNNDARSASLKGENQKGGDNSEGQQADGSKGSPGSRQGGTSQSQSTRGGTAGAQNGLAAWNPIIPARGLNTLEDGRGSLARQTSAISQRIREITNRMTGGELTDAELEALRRHANQLRRLNGDPLADQGEAMLRVIDQIELTALNAAARAKGDTPAHATLPSPDSPRYREAVAEYYRRLGNR